MNALAVPRSFETIAGPGMPVGTIIALVIALVIGIAWYLWYAIALSKLFPRLGEAGWKGWVPVLNEATIMSLGGKAAWNAILLYIPIVQLYALYVKVVAVHRINQRFDRGAGATVLAVLLPPVWATVLVVGPPPYPEGDRLAGIRPGPLRRPADAPATPPHGYLAPPILPPGSVAPPAPIATDAGAPARSFAPPAPPAPPAAPAAPAGQRREQPFSAAQDDAPAPVIDSVPWTSPATRAAAPPPPPAPPAPPAQPAPSANSAPPAPSASPAAAPPPAAPPLVHPAAAAPPAPSGADFATADTVDAPPAALRSRSSASPYAPPAEAPASASDDAGSPAGTGAPAYVRPAPASPAASHVPSTRPPAAAADDGAEEEFDATVVVSRRRGARRVLVLDDGRRFALSATSIVIGRNPEGQPGEQRLSIPDKTRTLSKTHARLVVQGDEWRLTDLRSTNGVVVVADDGAETLLDPGESVIGAGRFVLGEVGMHVAVETGS